MIKIGLIGDRDDSVVAHQAIPRALALAGQELDSIPDVQWLSTDSLESGLSLIDYHGLWCVPASPYVSMQGALSGIQFARENKRPFLGTCGGFQHAVIEYARSVLGWQDADHAETSAQASLLLMTPLQCPLVEVAESVSFVEGSQLFSAYQCDQSSEGYHCSFGLNHEFEEQLLQGELQVAARGQGGSIRALELESHPFFVTTLFQPERAALKDRTPPIVKAFLQACIDNSRTMEK